MSPISHFHPLTRVALVTVIALLGLWLFFAISAAQNDSPVQQKPSSELSQAEKDKIGSEAAEVTSSFSDWAKVYLASANPAALISQGTALASKRREILKQLIIVDPARALSLAFDTETIQQMPVEIRENLEEQIGAYGDFMVIVADQVDPNTGAFIKSRIERSVIIRDRVYKASVYGRWLNMTSKRNIPINGIVIDDVMAVAESPVRTLSLSEAARLSAQGNLAGNEVAVDIGGELVSFRNEQELTTYIQSLVSRESMIGPDTEAHKEQLDSLTADSVWTEGQKSVLVIRIDFAEKPGEPLDSSNQPLTVARAHDLIINQVSPFYVKNSYNKTSMITTVTPVVRMPQPQSSYFNSSGLLFTDCESAAKAAGYDPANFNLELCTMSYNAGFSYAGVASVGARGAALNGSFGLKVTAHELGHNYGLLHANLWRTTDGSVIGPGNNVEYGNPFDVMGTGFDSRAHFTAHYKWRLNWLTDTNIQYITTDGTYRVFAHDSTTPGEIRGIHVRKNTTKNYWIEFRQLLTDNSSVFNGAVIGWDYASRSYRENQLLDMTPNTSTASDAPLLIGQVFNDTENRIRISVLGKGNTTPQSLDVKVEFNVGCTFSLSQTSQSLPASGGEGTLPVNTLSGCVPPASSNNEWLSVFPTDSGVHYIVSANYDFQPRTGTIIVAGQTFTVQQAAATTACVSRPSGLVAWWRGDGNARDQTGVNNGTLTGAMTFSGGKIGGGFLGNYSNNAGVVEVPDSPSLALYHSMTFEGWLKIDSYGGTVIERRADFPGNSYSVWMPSNGELNFTIWYNGSSGTGVYSDPLPIGQFVHFAASLDDATGQIKMYINGSLVRQFITSRRPFVVSNAKIYIGNINGITDEPSVYNRALSASEIQAIYNAGIASTGATGKCLSSTCPTITNLSTAIARVGDAVTISGSGFLNAIGVKFSNNVSAGFTVISDSQITTTVPAAAVTGPITVSKASCADAQSSSITIDRCPSITNLSASIAGVGQTITINGIGFLNVTGVKFSNNVSATFNIASDSQMTTVVPSGAASGPITLNKNNCANAISGSITICPNSPVTLAVDDGQAEASFGFSNGVANSFWVNRLTPSSYPATLTAVVASVGLPTSTNFNIVVGTNPVGTSNINNTISQTIPTTVGAQSGFNYYPVTPTTINSGDFVVGFSFVPNGSGPARLDQTAPSRGRSYYSTSGTNFTNFDTFSPGNLLIRAEVFPGTCPNAVPSAPAASAGTNITSISFTANWSSSSATGYRLDVSTVSTFSSFVSGYQNLDVGNVLNRSVTGLNTNTTYFYRVRAYNAGGTSSSSNTITVTTLNSPPPAPTANAATTVTSNSFTSNWSSSSGASGYRLDVSTISTFSSFVSGYQNLDVGTSLSRPVSGLAVATLYYYRVRAYNAAGTSANSNTITVSTLGPMIFIEQGTANRAAALDSILWLKGPFKVLNFFNFTPDNHTRVILFTSHLGLTQPDTSQLAVRAGGVTLTVESVGPVTGVTGMNASYIVVRLPDGLPAGDLPLVVTLRGLASVNSPTLAIASSGP